MNKKIDKTNKKTIFFLQFTAFNINRLNIYKFKIF